MITCYQKAVQFFKNTCRATVSLPGNSDPAVVVTFSDLDRELNAESDDEAVLEKIRSLEGEYYELGSDENLFVRYLCKAELCAFHTETLSLMRNTIYAAHGRAFQDPILTQYMEEKPWYRKLTEPEDFSEDKSLQLMCGFDRKIGIGTQYIKDLLSRHLEGK